jgi:isopenicillin N synthase-like dioxygenase
MHNPVTSSLARIDLSSPDLQKSASLVRQASLDSGFFYVINHGISEEFLETVFRQSRAFFGLPKEEKMKLLRNEKHRGYTPFQDETLDPDKQTEGDSKEGFYIGVELAENDPQASKEFYGPNIWPSTEKLEER